MQNHRSSANSSNLTFRYWRAFLLPQQENGQKFRAEIIECNGEFNDKLNSDPFHIKFRCSINDEQYGELMTYQQVMDLINQDEEDPVYWSFKRITAHEGPLERNSPSYQGSKYNVMVEWENGEVMSESLSIIAIDAPAICVQYMQEIMNY